MSANTQITQLSIAYVSVATSLSSAFIKIAEVSERLYFSGSAET